MRCWRAPADNGGRSDVWFTVDCHSCDDKFVLYRPRQAHLNDTSYVSVNASLVPLFFLSSRDSLSYSRPDFFLLSVLFPPFLSLFFPLTVATLLLRLYIIRPTCEAASSLSADAPLRHFSRSYQEFSIDTRTPRRTETFRHSFPEC